MQSWLKNQIELSEIFSDKWTLSYSKANENDVEHVKIDEQGNYFANDVYSFNIIVTELSNSRIVLNKHRLDGELHSVETLTRNQRFIRGTDTKGFNLQYKKG